MNDSFLKELKKKYRYKNWLIHVNWLSGQSFDRDQAIAFEKKELDEWWWGEHYTDFSRYDSWHYLYAGLNCFNNYSKPCAFYAHQYLGDKNIKSIVDVGAGIGLSTILLADLFPDSEVYYNNIEGSLQKKFFDTHKQDRIKFISNYDLVRSDRFDMLFASEYFEHFQDSTNWTSSLLSNGRFKYLVVNNSFNVRAYGHFKDYFHKGISVMPKQMSKLWLKQVRADYDEMKIKCWNGRPKIFVLK
jgi:hypothetical protein